MTSPSTTSPADLAALLSGADSYVRAADLVVAFDETETGFEAPGIIVCPTPTAVFPTPTVMPTPPVFATVRMCC